MSVAGEKGDSGHIAPRFEGGAEHERALTGVSVAPARAFELEKAAEEHGYHSHTGLVVDIDEARREFGDEIASKLKLAKDGRTILWPQPDNHPEDPQNWSDRKKMMMLLIISAAAFVPDFISSCGIASLFPLAAQYGTTTDEINNLTSNWSIFMLGPGGILWVFLIKKIGRLPALFWSQFLGLAWVLGCTFAPNLSAFAAFRILAATFQTAPQVSGLYVITDMYPFHLQARHVNFWTLAFVASPFIGPAILGFIVGAGITWRWVYGAGSIYCAVVLFLIIFFMEETMYDRHIRPVPSVPMNQRGVVYRIKTLAGITGWRMRHHRPSWFRCVYDTFEVVIKPTVLLPCLYIMWVFGFGIGINVTNAVFVGTPRIAGGYGLTPNQQSGSYFSPIIGALIGEFFGRYFNDWLAAREIKRNHGVFEPEMRLWTIYVALPFFVGGFLMLGYAFEYKLNFALAVVGWIMAEFAILTTTVCTYAYLTNVEPYRQGEMSALINMFRILGGFAVPYFQIPWAEKAGAHVTFGVEAAIVAGLCLLIIPVLQLKGKALRTKYPSSK